jgi:glutathione S-transferase
MKLYFAPGTCSLHPHIALVETGLPFELVRVDTRSHKTSDGRDFYAINPKGYVPALELDDGSLLTEGAVIT